MTRLHAIAAALALKTATRQSHRRKLMTTNDNPAPNDDERVSVNGHLDHHLGFIDSGIADDIR